MSLHSRRTLLSALGLVFPLGLSRRAGASAAPAHATPTIRFRPFEDAVRDAFARGSLDSPGDEDDTSAFPCRRIEIGHSDLVQAGIQGCHNDRPFAGFPAGHLRILRTRSEPGPIQQGVRLYISSVDLALTGGSIAAMPGRPLDFHTLPPAPCLG